MADLFGAAESLLGGFGSFISGNTTAQGAKAAAQSYGEAAALTKASTVIKQSMVGRQVYQALGGMRAAAGASGLTQGGSVQDLIRDSARQGAITKAVVGLQGEIDYNSLIAQQHSSEQQAQAAKEGGGGGLFGGILGAIGSLF